MTQEIFGIPIETDILPALSEEARKAISASPGPLLEDESRALDATVQQKAPDGYMASIGYGLLSLFQTKDAGPQHFLLAVRCTDGKHIEWIIDIAALSVMLSFSPREAAIRTILEAMNRMDLSAVLHNPEVATAELSLVPETAALRALWILTRAKWLGV